MRAWREPNRGSRENAQGAKKGQAIAIGTNHDHSAVLLMAGSSCTQLKTRLSRPQSADQLPRNERSVEKMLKIVSKMPNTSERWLRFKSAMALQTDSVCKQNAQVEPKTVGADVHPRRRFQSYQLRCSTAMLTAVELYYSIETPDLMSLGGLAMGNLTNSWPSFTVVRLGTRDTLR